MENVHFSMQRFYEESYRGLEELWAPIASLARDFHGFLLESLTLRNTHQVSNVQQSGEPIFRLLIDHSEKLSRATSPGEILRYASLLSETWDRVHEYGIELNNRKYSSDFFVNGNEIIRKIERNVRTLSLDIHERNIGIIEQERTKTIEMIANFQKHTTASMEALQSEINIAATATKNINIRLENELKRAKELYKDTSEYLNTRKTEVDILVGEISDKALSGGFSAMAKSEGDKADWYRRFAIGAMVLIAGAAGFILYQTLADNITIGQAILKAITLIVIAGPAAYLAKESGRHRDFQNHFQQTALDIHGISPYLAKLDKPDSDRIKAELALKIFTRQPPTSKATQQMDNNLQEFILKLVERAPLK